MNQGESEPPPATAPTSAVELAEGIWIARRNLRHAFSRSSGPGGQAVNKLSTRVELRVAVGDIEGLDDEAVARLRRLAGQRLTHGDEIVIHAQLHRSQIDNRRACLDRLRTLVAAAAIVPRRRRRLRPSRAMIERRLQRKRRLAEKKLRRRWRPDE